MLSFSFYLDCVNGFSLYGFEAEGGRDSRIKKILFIIAQYFLSLNYVYRKMANWQCWFLSLCSIIGEIQLFSFATIVRSLVFHIIHRLMRCSSDLKVDGSWTSMCNSYLFCSFLDTSYPQIDGFIALETSLLLFHTRIIFGRFSNCTSTLLLCVIYLAKAADFVSNARHVLWLWLV